MNEWISAPTIVEIKGFQKGCWYSQHKETTVTHFHRIMGYSQKHGDEIIILKEFWWWITLIWEFWGNTSEWMNEWVGGWVVEWVSEWINRWIDICLVVHGVFNVCWCPGNISYMLKDKYQMMVTSGLCYML